MKERNSDINKRRLMDALASPPHFGPLIGLLATTFEMQPEFFEIDFLPAALNLGAWDDRSWTSRIEIEKKLAYMESATVFVDASRYRNRPRSLRVKIVPVFLGKGRAFHPKIVLLVYENALRLTVGSANLTHPGFRENREVGAVLTATEKRPQDAALISAALSNMPDIMKRLDPECEKLIGKALDYLEPLRSTTTEENEWFVWGEERNPLWRTFLSYWPDKEEIQKITIMSPFWSEDEKQTALTIFVDALKERAIYGQNVQIKLLTEAAPDKDNTYKPTLPQSFGQFDFTSIGALVSAQAVDPAVLKDEVGIEGFIRHRHLHAKVVLLEGEETTMAYLGSANFTRRGWGFTSDALNANVEAGLIIRREKARRKSITGLIPALTGSIVELRGEATERLAKPDPDPSPLPWPSFLKGAILVPSSEDPQSLDLDILIEPSKISGEWSLCVVLQDAGPGAGLIFNWAQKQMEAEVYTVSLKEGQLNALLREQELIVHWWGHDEGQPFPVNVSQEARHRLPVTPGQHKFSEQHLILYYQGRIAWEDLFPDEELSEGAGNESSRDKKEYDGVDTSRITSYQVREFVEALKGIADDLRFAAAATEPAMRLALLGPVSPVSLAQAVMDAIASKNKSPIAAGFQLVEIRACLDDARSYHIQDKYKDAWQKFLCEATETINRNLKKIREDCPELFGNSGPFAGYEHRIREYYMSEVRSR